MPRSYLALMLSIGLLCLPLSVGQAAPKKAAMPQTITVTRLTWHGWPDSVRISNGVVEAIVVPAIGRVMSFQFVGQPQTSPIFNNADWQGKTVADADAGTWAAFGGDKLWPSPQSEWTKHNIRAWPPDQTFDGDPEVAEILPNGVRLTTPNSVAFAAHAVRTITLKPGEARLYIVQTLVKDADAANPDTLPTDLSDEQAGRLKRDGFPSASGLSRRRAAMRRSFCRSRLPASSRRVTHPSAARARPKQTPTLLPGRAC